VLKDNTEVSVIEDVYIVALLVKKGFKPIPFIKDRSKRNDSRVAWNVEGDISEVIIKYYEGCYDVDLYDYVKTLKDVRAEMYNLKQANKSQTEKGE